MTKTTTQNEKNTTQRPWHDLKPGDVIWFTTGWYEIFDAYAVGYDTVKVKLIVDNAYTCHIETYNVRTSGHAATCRA